MRTAQRRLRALAGDAWQRVASAAAEQCVGSTPAGLLIPQWATAAAGSARGLTAAAASGTGHKLWPAQQLQLLRLRCSGSSSSTPHSWPARTGPSARSLAWQLQARAAMHSQQQQPRSKQAAVTDNALYLGAVVLGMIGLSYASVPLYRLYCQATGYGGKLGQATGVEDKLKRRQENPNPEMEAKAAARELRVWFSSDVAEDMPWRFTPTQDFVKIRPGQSTLVFFTAENRSDKPITGVSTYNVVPDKAALYFNKVQCFCFEEQRLRPGEVVDMPVFFYIDPEMVDDFNCRNIHDITLSYTFYKVDDEDSELAAADPDGTHPGGVRVHTWTSGPLPSNITVAPGVALPPGVAPAAAAAADGEGAAAKPAAAAAAAAAPAAAKGAGVAPGK